MSNYPIPTHPTWEIIDPSKMKNYIECPRSFFYRHILGWVGENPNNHLVFGQAWHIAMEHLLLNGYSPESVLIAGNKLEESYRREFSGESDDLYSPKTPFRAILALNEYGNKYKNDLDKYEVLYTETHGAVPVSEKFILFYRIDSILRDKEHGYIFSLEHKTGTTFSNKWAMQWPLSMQVGAYCHALYCLFPPGEVRGVKINGTFFKRTKAPLFEFERVPCWKGPNQMLIWFENVNTYIHDLDRDFATLEGAKDSDAVLKAFPMRPTSCDNYYGCPYHDFCTTWSNPLQKADEPPIGFKCEFWDPRTEVKENEEVKGFQPIEEIEGMIRSMSNVSK